MRIDELIGIKKYRDKTASEFYDDYMAAGGEFFGSGQYGHVIGPANGNHVWKIFRHDPCYLKYVRWVLRNPDPAFPVFLSKPFRFVPPYRRLRTDAYVYVVKMERLYPIQDPDLQKTIDRVVEGGYRFLKLEPAEVDKVIADYQDAVRAYEQAKAPMETHRLRMAQLSPEERAEYRKAIPKIDQDAVWNAHSRVSELKNMAEYYQRYRDLLASNPSLEGLIRAYHEKYLPADLQCAEDLKPTAYMQRRDGTLVLIDPLWEGETPFQAHDKAMRAEYHFPDDADEPSEDDYVRGGELPKRRRKKLKPKAPPPADLDDFPF